jgi:hypothetical protein
VNWQRIEEHFQTAVADGTLSLMEVISLTAMIKVGVARWQVEDTVRFGTKCQEVQERLLPDVDS